MRSVSKAFRIQLSIHDLHDDGIPDGFKAFIYAPYGSVSQGFPALCVRGKGPADIRKYLILGNAVFAESLCKLIKIYRRAHICAFRRDNDCMELLVIILRDIHELDRRSPVLLWKKIIDPLPDRVLQPRYHFCAVHFLI